MATKQHSLNATVVGDGPITLVLGNGLGTNQDSWRHIVAGLEGHRIVRFDYAGSPNASADSFHPERYRTLFGHVDDVVDLLDELEVENAIFVGHSVSGMIALLAAVQIPERIARVVTIGASPRYLNDETVGYTGGFSHEAIEGLLHTAATDYQAWVAGFSPLVIGDPNRADLVGEFAAYLLAMRPDIATQTLRTVFMSDHRDALPRVQQPVTVIQPREDVAVPVAVGVYLAERLGNATLRMVDLSGHVPHLTNPELVLPIVRSVIAQHAAAA